MRSMATHGMARARAHSLSLTHTPIDTPAPVETGDESRCGLADRRDDLVVVAIDGNEVVPRLLAVILAERVGPISRVVAARKLMHNLQMFLF